MLFEEFDDLCEHARNVPAYKSVVNVDHHDSVFNSGSKSVIHTGIVETSRKSKE
jgi:hypothetical protein